MTGYALYTHKGGSVHFKTLTLCCFVCLETGADQGAQAGLSLSTAGTTGVGDQPSFSNPFYSVLRMYWQHLHGVQQKAHKWKLNVA